MIIHISAKCSDLFSLFCEHGEYTGYVPDFFPGQHYGDYVDLEIDTKTGQIKNWKPVADSAVKKILTKD